MDVEDLARLAEGSEKAPSVDWRAQYAGIRAMRAKQEAPVDTMGCDVLHDPAAPVATQRFQVLVSLMLSSQTKDEVTYGAMQRLRAHGCTAAAVAATAESELEKLIYPVGFFRNKAKFIREAASRVAAGEWGGEIPDTVEGLCSLKGVGPKMAYICMTSAWGRVQGIGVDVHVHRIADRLRWTKGAKDPEATRAALEAWLPRPLWREVNHVLVGFGQTTCLPRNPLCGECLIRSHCPEGRKWRADPSAPASPTKRRSAQLPPDSPSATGKRPRDDGDDEHP
jgi:endonuclease-3